MVTKVGPNECDAALLWLRTKRRNDVAALDEESVLFVDWLYELTTQALGTISDF